MLGKVIDYGHFELFESERGRVLLVTNNANTYIWSRKDKIESLRITEGISEKSGDRHYKLVLNGPYFIITVEDDKNFPGLPHLYLKNMDHYEEYVIGGFPDLVDQEREIVRTNRIIPAEEIETFAYQKV